MQPESRGGLVLNIGCGADNYGDVRVDLFRSNTTVLLADSQHLPFKDEVFTEVYERNLLEHLPNPGVHLQEAQRVLSRGGVLKLITDNAACLKFYVLGTHTGGYRKHGGLDVHYALFTEEHIRNFLTGAGLNIRTIQLVDTDYYTRNFDRLVRLFFPSLSYPRIFAEAVKP